MWGWEEGGKEQLQELSLFSKDFTHSHGLEHAWGHVSLAFGNKLSLALTGTK